LQGKKTKPIIDSLKSEKYHTPDEWMKGLNWLSSEFQKRNFEPIDSIDVSGGEPFCYKDFVFLLEKLLMKFPLVNITSNLALLPDTFFTIHPSRIGLTVSMHLDENKKPYKTFLNNIMKLRLEGHNFTINFVAHPSQIHELGQVKRLAGAMGCYWHFEPYIDYNSPVTKFGEMPLEETQYIGENFTTYDKYGIGMEQKRMLPSKCRVLDQYIVIMENGDVFPCLGQMFEQKYKIANIFEMKLYMEPISPILCDIFCPCAQNYRDDYR